MLVLHEFHVLFSIVFHVSCIHNRFILKHIIQYICIIIHIAYASTRCNFSSFNKYTFYYREASILKHII